MLPVTIIKIYICYVIEVLCLDRTIQQNMLLVACLYLDYSVFRSHCLPTSCVLQLFDLGTKTGNVIHSFLLDTGN